MPPKRRHSILMVSDFFLPRVGGVETHIRSLSSKLAENHKVTILTSSSNSSHGLLPLGPLKIYYLPLLPLSSGTSLPTFFSSYIFFKTVIIREGITLVHGHQATSVLANECLFYASLLNIPTCSTDHSLFPLNDLATLHLSAAQRLVARADMHIGVSEVTCANVVLRNKIDPNKVKTIPNAVDGLVFKPLIKSEKGNKYDRIKIVVLSRLCYRKGTDILIKVIPEIIRTNPHVDFLIGGDGNKSLPLLEMIENRNLESRVTMFGSVSRDNVPSFLQRGDIFLNTSLTESFCIAILEAACCGLVVVSTDVGGVREVLRGCKVEREGGVVYGGVGEELSKKYTWTKIAGQVEKVYDEVSENKTPLSLWEMMEVWCTNRSYIEACVAVAFSLMVLLGMRAIDLFRNERTVEVDTERDRLYDNGGGNNSRGRARSKSRGGAEGRRRGSRGRPTN
ncbi:hypothetical protein TrLO_g3132 [Triparma laevis f. longispina]|uniref:Phosphatidylinositol N-acetylglucosaminyltransferase n=2 Tax=Triparma laevis TaxID=1534972 RepID=A0A9W7C2W8_9STRA|nr:hypothetical protein TrLO_g3132 [Triparma laevis f. longispina]